MVKSLPPPPVLLGTRSQCPFLWWWGIEDGGWLRSIIIFNSLTSRRRYLTRRIRRGGGGRQGTLFWLHFSLFSANLLRLDWRGRLLCLPFHVLLVIYVRLQIYTASVGWRFKGAENGVWVRSAEKPTSHGNNKWFYWSRASRQVLAVQTFAASAWMATTHNWMETEKHFIKVATEDKLNIRCHWGRGNR